MDVHDSVQRSYNMSQIKNKNTKPEMFIRKIIFALGFRYRLHRKNLPGNPDIVFVSKKKVIFIHGCFWHKHKCRYFEWPQNNKEFWKKKITENIKRDKKNLRKLTATGWQYLIIWECEIKDINSTIIKIIGFLE